MKMQSYNDVDIQEKYMALKTEKNLIFIEMKKLEIQWGRRLDYSTGHIVESNINGNDIEVCSCGRNDGPCVNFDGQRI